MLSFNVSKFVCLLLLTTGLVSGCGTTELRPDQKRLGNGAILDSKTVMAAAKSGDMRQQYLLALLYLEGDAGLPKDPKLAADWLAKAANQGDAKSQFLLGDLYIDGIGVKKNHQMALKLYQKSAEQSFPMGMYSLGAMYGNGFAIKKDLTKARYWFNQAILKGDTQSQKRARKALLKLDKQEAK